MMETLNEQYSIASPAGGGCSCWRCWKLAIGILCLAGVTWIGIRSGAAFGIFLGLWLIPAMSRTLCITSRETFGDLKSDFELRVRIFVLSAGASLIALAGSLIFGYLAWVAALFALIAAGWGRAVTETPLSLIAPAVVTLGMYGVVFYLIRPDATDVVGEAQRILRNRLDRL